MKNRLLSVIILLSLIFYGIAGYHFLTGWPPVVMMFIGIFLGLVINMVLYALFLVIGKLLRKIPLKSIVAVLSGIGGFIILKFVGFGWPTLFYSAIVALGIFFCIALYGFLGKKSLLTGSALGIALLGVGYVLYALADQGTDPFDKEVPLAFADNDDFSSTQGQLENPAAAGPYGVSTFTYGSGTDKNRDEFAEGVTYTTNPVNAKGLIPDWKGKKKKWRERYWGFGAKDFPLNGRVYMPEGEGPFPLTLIVHGNHSMIDYSDDGYGYLGELLASRGIIAVSVDENFLNGHWSGDFRGKEMPARAWLLLKHLEQWESWNATKGHGLARKVDMDNIMLVGHSRGGEAVSIAAAFNKLPYFPDNAKEKFDFGFDIKGVVALAPTDYRYDRKIILKDLNFLSLQGSYDSDEVSFWGMRPYHRLQYTDSISRFKSGVYIHHANHGQFNSTWGNSDFGAPSKWLLNLDPLLEEGQQQEAAKVFISAFAESTLKYNKAYRAVFKNIAIARPWLPMEHYLTHFEASGFKTIADFEEDFDITGAKDGTLLKATDLALWKERNLTSRDGGSQENNALILGWDHGDAKSTMAKGTYKISLSDADKSLFDLGSYLQLTLGAGNHEWLQDNDAEDKKEGGHEKEEREVPRLDFSIQLTDGSGQTSSLKVSEVKAIPKPLKTRFTKFKFLDKEMIGEDWEVQLQTYHFPLETFMDRNADLDLERVSTIEFIFDQSPYGVVVMDRIGVGTE